MAEGVERGTLVTEALDGGWLIDPVFANVRAPSRAALGVGWEGVEGVDGRGGAVGRGRWDTEALWGVAEWGRDQEGERGEEVDGGDGGGRLWGQVDDEWIRDVPSVLALGLCVSPSLALLSLPSAPPLHPLSHVLSSPALCGSAMFHLTAHLFSPSPPPPIPLPLARPLLHRPFPPISSHILNQRCLREELFWHT